MRTHRRRYAPYNVLLREDRKNLGISSAFRCWLGTQSVILQQYHSRRLKRTLAIEIYETTEDKDEAVEME